MVEDGRSMGGEIEERRRFEALRSTPEGREQLRQQLDRAMKAWARDPIIPVRQRPEFQISPQLRNRRIIR